VWWFNLSHCKRIFRIPKYPYPRKSETAFALFMAPTSMAGLQSKMQISRASTTRRPSTRGQRLVVQAKVDLQGGPRVIRGKCFVTRDVSAGGAVVELAGCGGLCRSLQLQVIAQTRILLSVAPEPALGRVS